MNTIILLLVLFLAEIGYVQSRDVKFSIITFGKKASVNIPALNQTINLNPTIFYNGVQSGYVNGCPDEEFEYTYLIDGKPEPGVNIRKLPAGEFTTYNEFIGRPETISKLKGMGYPQDQEWTRSYGKTELFDDSYIPTVVIDNTNVPKYFSSPYDFGKSDEKTKVPLNAITFILKESIFTDKNVLTAQKSRYNDKVQFKVKLNDGHKLYKRKSLKFRATGAEDPSFLGESLYADLAKTIGNPVHDKVFVRVYLIDGTPIGLYNMIDVTASKAFLKTEFYGDIKGKENKDQKEVGAIFECHSSDFEKGMSCENKKVDKNSKEKRGEDDKEDDEKYTKKDEEKDNKKVASLIEAMDKVNVKDEASIKEFSEKWLDLDTFFKALSLEYLCGHWDSYWEYSDTVEVAVEKRQARVEDDHKNTGVKKIVVKKPVDKQTHPTKNTPETKEKAGPAAGAGAAGAGAGAAAAATKQVQKEKKTINKPTNYVLYQDPRLSTEKTFKFYFIDQDFDQTFGVGKKVCGPDCSFKQLISEHQVRAAKLFLKEDTLTRKMFEEHLKSIVQHAFNPVALGRRIEEYERRYATEIEWDFSEGTYRDRKDRDHPNRNNEHHPKSISYDDHIRGLKELKKYIETRAKTVTKDLNFEWDPIPMEPIEKEVKVISEEKQKLKFKKVEEESDGHINKVISTSTILAMMTLLFLQFFI